MTPHHVPSLDLEQLYRGFVLSFSSLGIQVYNTRYNAPLFTHQVIDYWARVGLSLGFYPWAEYQYRDLEWWYPDPQLKGDLDPQTAYKAALHLESENSPGRMEYTVRKLAGSSAPYAVGLVHTAREADVQSALSASESLVTDGRKLLVIAVLWAEPKVSADEAFYDYRVRAWQRPHQRDLPEAWLSWPRSGALTMHFQREVNWLGPMGSQPTGEPEEKP